jgi:hypothetical protein
VPTESIVVTLLVVAAFSIFAAVLFVSVLLDWRAARRIEPAE